MRQLPRERIEEIGGRVTEDPTANPQDGDQLIFQPTVAKLLESDETVFMTNLGAFNGTVLAFSFAGHADHNMDGSAVMVAPGVALTAKHVIEQHLDRLKEGGMHAICFGIVGGTAYSWGVRKVTMLDNLDIAILGLELNSEMPLDRTLRQASISTRLPRIDERVQIVGFRAESATRILDSGARGYSARVNLIVSAGVVTNRYPTGRDKVMLPWPVLEVSCPSWGGMSGGPVFDESGKLIGLLCSSFSEDGGGGRSYISLLWPALASRFEGGWPVAAFRGSRTLLEMSPRFCCIDRPEVITCTLDEAGRAVTHYSAWE